LHSNSLLVLDLMVPTGFRTISMSIVERLAAEVLDQAKSNRLTICTAESCSAGRLALALSKGEGASQHLMGGVVAYTKEMKIRALGVPAELIQSGTAVCADVAEAMARGARRLSGATLAVSITGVAGPEPDEDGNPVGLVYCSVARIDASKVIELHSDAKQPDAVIDDACVEALKLVRSFCRS
jgi:nicotinamide-nucleotide amidase